MFTHYCITALMLGTTPSKTGQMPQFSLDILEEYTGFLNMQKAPFPLNDKHRYEDGRHRE